MGFEIPCQFNQKRSLTICAKWDASQDLGGTNLLGPSLPDVPWSIDRSAALPVAHISPRSKKSGKYPVPSYLRFLSTHFEVNVSLTLKLRDAPTEEPVPRHRSRFVLP